MAQSSTAGFFTGGGKGISWPTVGTSVTGVITAVHEPEPVRDPKTGEPTGSEQVRIELQTELRDSSIDFDDGQRTLYVKSYMRGAIGDALRKAGAKEPKVGGKLTVTFDHTEPPDRPGLSESKHFKAVYEPPSSTGSFFSGGGGGAATGNGSPQRPAAITEAAWAAMDDTTKKAVSATMSSGEPPF